MMPGVVLYVTLLGVAWMFGSSYTDMLLFKNKKTRKLVYQENILPRTEMEIYKVYLGVNGTEVGLFLVGFWAASFLAIMGWLM